MYIPSLNTIQSDVFSLQVFFSFTNVERVGELTLVERVGEHLNLKQNKPSAIKSHIFSCETCFNSKLGCHNFEILKKCQSDYDSQISEAFFIKKLKPEMNSQLFNSGSSFLLNIFN